jgi:NTE family protein
MSNEREITVVCGGGGIWGVAWMTGLVSGLADAGIDIRQACAFIGTSAGAVMSSQLTSTLSTAALYQRQVDPAKQRREVSPTPGALERMTDLMRHPWPSNAAKVRAVCELADTVQTIPRAQRRADIVERLGLPEAEWPEKRLSITAVDMATQDLVVFTNNGDVSLEDAVAASCAVPGVWPTAEINGRYYIDGGAWKTAENAHLAQGAKSVLILAPMGNIAGAALGGLSGLATDVAALREQGSDVMLISADEMSLRAMGRNPLDPATRKPAAEAGRLQGAVEAARLRPWF